MITIPWPTDLLRIGDLTCMSLAEPIDLAARMRAAGPATRTRLSAEAAAHRLGMVPVALHAGDLQLDHDDAIDDQHHPEAVA